MQRAAELPELLDACVDILDAPCEQIAALKRTLQSGTFTVDPLN
jgi:hypothetical protein